MPKISVVIPLFNKEPVFKNTLTSVLAQELTDFEVVIIDDGSTDGSGSIATSFTDSRIRYFKTENQGVSAARNLGVQKSESELIAFLDADDFWFPNHLAELYQLYLDFPSCGMLSSRYTKKISDKKLTTNYFVNLPKDYYGIIPNFFEANFVDRIITSSSVLIPKKILTHVGGFNKNVNSGEDTELWTKIAIQYPVAIHNKVTAIYHFEISDSLSKKNISSKKIFDFDQFRNFEKDNLSLKAFLDIYRIEYALQFRIVGLKDQSKRLLKEVTTKIPTKTKFLLLLPSWLLKRFLTIKHWLKRRGIDFTVYH